MKTKFTFLLIALFGLSSCIKDHIGDGGNDVQLTEENHLSSGALFILFAEEEIVRLDNIIDNPNDYTDEEIEAAKNDRETLKIQIANTDDIYTVFDIPRPCPNDPTGKCIPSRLEYFVFPANIQEALVVVTTSNGETEGVSDELEPLTGFGSDLQFIRVPVENVENELIIEIAWKDSIGDPTNLKVTLSN